MKEAEDLLPQLEEAMALCKDRMMETQAMFPVHGRSNQFDPPTQRVHQLALEHLEEAASAFRSLRHDLEEGSFTVAQCAQLRILDFRWREFEDWQDTVRNWDFDEYYARKERERIEELDRREQRLREEVKGQKWRREAMEWPRQRTLFLIVVCAFTLVLALASYTRSADVMSIFSATLSAWFGHGMASPRDTRFVLATAATALLAVYICLSYPKIPFSADRLLVLPERKRRVWRTLAWLVAGGAAVAQAFASDSLSPATVWNLILGASLPILALIVVLVETRVDSAGWLALIKGVALGIAAFSLAHFISLATTSDLEPFVGGLLIGANLMIMLAAYSGFGLAIGVLCVIAALGVPNYAEQASSHLPIWLVLGLAYHDLWGKA